MIRLEGFNKHYKSLHVVKDVSLEIRSGEAFVLLGANGCGKTTVLRSVAGLHAPSSGRVLIDGVDIASDPVRAKKRIAYLPQRVTLPELLTGREILEFYAGIDRIDLARVEEALEFVGLAGDANRFTREYSGGMVQRLGLAVTFLRRVPILLLDEPTLNLDPTGLGRFREWIGTLREEGSTIFFTSHILQEALRLADRVAVMAEGRIKRVQDVSGFRERVVLATTVKVVVDHLTQKMVDAARQAGAQKDSWSDASYSFGAAPCDRQRVIRAIEEAGGSIEELHTEPPDWESLVHDGLEGEL